MSLFFFFFFLATLSLACATPLGTDAHLLLSPLSHADFAAALAALPNTLASRSRFLTRNAATLRIIVHVPRRRTASPSSPTPQYEATLVDDGHALLLRDADDSYQSVTNLPVRGDTQLDPLIVRIWRGRVTVLVHTLSARMSNEIRNCDTTACLHRLATTVCAAAPTNHTTRAELEASILACARGTAATQLALGAWRLVYRLLFAVLTVAQLGVLAWGAAFSISFLAVEVSTLAEKLTRRALKCVATRLTRYHELD